MFLSPFLSVLVTPEVPQRKVSDSSIKSLSSTKSEEMEESWVKTYVLSPISSAISVMHQPRNPAVKRLLHLQILNCTLYWFSMEEQNMLYFFMSRKFLHFSGADFAVYTIVIKVSKGGKIAPHIFCNMCHLRLQGYLDFWSSFPC